MKRGKLLDRIASQRMGRDIDRVLRKDREYREAVGRLCCSLAREAVEVHRVVCGIGTVIKHG